MIPRYLIPALLLIALATAVPLAETPVATADAFPLELYEATVDANRLAELEEAGYDIVATERTPDGVRIRIVLAEHRAAELEEAGVQTMLWRNAEGLTANQIAARQQQEGFDVWRSWDEEGGLRDELLALAERHPDLVQVKGIGTSVQDRTILAVRVTEGADDVPEGSRPAVLFSSLQHAREWISGEVNRRMLHHLIDGHGEDAEITELLSQVEVWFIVVANPDGYQFTFESTRLWRKNMADNNGDGEIGPGDGVDLNRNFDAHWNYDTDGSSSTPGSETYRGPAAASEPETRAMQDFLVSLKPRFQVNYHSFANLLLYPLGWQDQTPSVDDAIFAALSGTVDNPAIPNFVPTLSAGLYITNGETCDFAYARAGTLCWTPELSNGGSRDAFEFPDDEDLVQQEFENVLPFAMDVVRSTAGDAGEKTPDDWVSSHLGNSPSAFLVDRFDVSYGNPQPVQVTAAKSLGPVTAMVRINGGDALAFETEPWAGGERYGVAGSRHYHRLRADVFGPLPGDEVEVWFEADDGRRSEAFTYQQVSNTNRPILVLAAEDYTGSGPRYERRNKPTYLNAYVDALAAAGYRADVYDIDARGRTAPSALGVLGHYDAVIWYTGDDVVTRSASQPSGQSSKLANDTLLAIRDYLNEGGRLLYTGKYAGYQYAAGYPYDPVADAVCGPDVDCARLSNDFLQYYLNTYAFERGHSADVAVENEAGTGRGFWSGSNARANTYISRTLDLTAVTSPVSLTMASAWWIEPGYDFGFVEVDDAGSWTTLPDATGHFTSTEDGWALTGFGDGDLSFDLSAFAGQAITLRLRYATDWGQEYAGWFVDDLTLSDARGEIWSDDLEDDPDGYGLGGWELVPIEPPNDYVIRDVVGTAEPFEGLRWSLGAEGESNQDHRVTTVATSRFMSPDEYPQFSSRGAARFDVPGTGPRTGDRFVYSDLTIYSYQRLTRTFDLTDAAEGELSLWLSHDIRDPYDAVFIEARTAGGDDWTTLPDLNGHTSQQSSLSCTTGSWYQRHPQLAHYMSVDGEGDDARCVPSGSTGEWHAATGNSQGWTQWRVDLSAYAGAAVEVSVAFVSSRLAYSGVLIDDVEASTGHATSFEDGLDGWEVSGPPEGSPPNDPDFFLASPSDYPYNAVTVTEDTIFFGFGLEGIVSLEERTTVLDRALGYLLRDVSARSTLYLPRGLNEDR